MPNKGHYRSTFRSVYGNVPVQVRSVEACRGCGESPAAPLFTRKFSTAAELRYLNAKLAALLPFGKVAEFLNEVLPGTAATNAMTVRNRTRRVGACTRFAFATNEYERGVREIRQGMEELGVNAETQITVLSDGDAGLRTVQREVAPEPEHMLDWFHIGMRFEHLLDASKAIHHMPTATHVAEWAHQVATRAKMGVVERPGRQNPQALGGTIPLDEIRARGGVGSAPAAPVRQRPAGLSASQSELAAELWGAPAIRQAHLHRLGGIVGRCSHFWSCVPPS